MGDYDEAIGQMSLGETGQRLDRLGSEVATGQLGQDDTVATSDHRMIWAGTTMSSDEYMIELQCSSGECRSIDEG
uniref:Uncharacterized protein n=1 Tax=Peronospora matthiolae TaxID=2874970 RepID=A0AAV1TVK6_9STRA